MMRWKWIAGVLWVVAAVGLVALMWQPIGSGLTRLAAVVLSACVWAGGCVLM